MVIIKEKGRTVVLNSDGSTKRAHEVIEFDLISENEKIKNEKMQLIKKKAQ